MTAKIRLENLTKQFPGQAEPAVDDLTMEIPEGEIVILVGPSGCGKTTTMKLINRLIEPTSGRIFLDGEDVTRVNADQLRRRIGYVIQQIGLFPHMTIEDNIATVPKLLGWQKSRISERIDELLDTVGMDPRQYRRRYPKELSGGQRQRVGVARALAADPDVMLMDEPFGAIDPITRERLQNEFLRIQSEIKKTIVFVTHDIDEAIKLGDRIAILRDQSRIAQYDTPERILIDPADEFVANFIGKGAALKRLNLSRIDSVGLLEWPTVVEGASAADVRRGLEQSTRPAVLVLGADRRPLRWVAQEHLGQLEGASPQLGGRTGHGGDRGQRHPQRRPERDARQAVQRCRGGRRRGGLPRRRRLPDREPGDHHDARRQRCLAEGDTVIAAVIDASLGARELGLTTGRRSLASYLFMPVLIGVTLAALSIWLDGQDLDSIESRRLTFDYLLNATREHIWLTLVSTGFVLVIAIPVGIMMTRPLFSAITSPAITVFNIGQATPSIGILGLFMLYWAVGFWPTIWALVAYSSLPVLRNTMVGLRQVDETVIESAQGMGLSRLQILWRIELPLAVPVILAGVRTALVINVGTAALAVFAGAGGLGTVINAGLATSRPLITFVGATLTALLALAVDYTAGVIEDVLRPRGL